ncbi:MAG: hypothetical protein J6D06_05195 [Clostridia bacterium]|nr:hypothetical protein [Clostridia bacterium]
MKPKEDTGTRGKIGKEEVEKAVSILKKYKEAKTSLEKRIVDNEQWFKLRHWEQLTGSEDDKNASAWLFNSIANKHADAMDNFPEVTCLPREASDETAANVLSQILPVVFERNGFERIYSDAWWYKLKAGTAVYGAFWNPMKNNGLGDIEIKQVDVLNLFWEPGIKDIQKSKNLFHVELTDNETLIALYPQLSGKLGGSSVEIAKYVYDDNVDTSEKSAVIDRYYKVIKDGVETLHYCKICNGELLYASENDPEYAERGFYDHGKYPFVFDSLFVEEGTPCGFGYIDIMKDAQKQIDILGNALVRNASMATNPRYFINSSGAVNEEEFADWNNNFVHVSGSNLGEDSIREIRMSGIPEIYLGILNSKIDELKETSGNRDFSQGGVSSGVTAASAIAALQEAGSKLTRDMVKGGYRAFSELNALAIELIRQFYDEPRFFRIISENGEQEFVSYDNSAIRVRNQGEAFGVSLGDRKPIFDIKVNAQKSSPFSKISQNELALQLYNSGMFNPEMRQQALLAISMMDFEGKSALAAKLSAEVSPL